MKEGCSLIMDIGQPRKQNHPAGFVLLKGAEPCPESTREAASRVVGGLPWHQNSFKFQNVKVGTYNLLPQTFHPKSLGGFTIRIRSVHAKVKQLNATGGRWVEDTFFSL